MLALQVYKYAIQLNKHVYLRVMRQVDIQIMAHIWIITFDVAPWEGGGGDTYCKKVIFPGISYLQI